MTSLAWLTYFCFLVLGNSLKCNNVSDTTLPCIEVSPCILNDSVTDVQLTELSDGSGLATSYSNLSVCFNESGLYVSQINYEQGLLTTSNSISECNDPVSNSNSASIYIAPDTKTDMQCFTEFDVSPVNISYHAGVYISRLPLPVQNFEMECNSSGLESTTMIDQSISVWQVEFFLPFATINCPFNCPLPQANCDGLNTNTSFNNDDDTQYANAEEVYRANFFRVNELMVLSGNGQCTQLQNIGRCQTLAWVPTPDLHNTSNFGYLLLQFEDEEIVDYSFDNNFDDMYKDVMIIIAIFVFLVLLIYIWCFQNLKENQLHPRVMVDKSALPSPSVDVTIGGISYYVPVPTETAKTDQNLFSFPENGKGYFKQLLHSVTLTVERNKVTAIMGPSGAGKTTLMDLIVSRKQDGVVIGNISFNGSPIDKCSYNVAYVQSTDVQIGEFTVIQSLYFAALLRLSSHNGFQKEDCYDRCAQVAASVGLTNVLHTVIGSALKKGISGGQMRRLTIATELLADPHVICLDEPTTGLDSATSLQLALMLNNLAVHKNKTILCTVHQPSDDMLNIWDRLILMGSGKVIYSGDMKELAGYMKEQGHVVSKFQNGLAAAECNKEEGTISKSDCVEFVLELLHERDTLDLLATQWSNHCVSDQPPSHEEQAKEQASESAESAVTSNMPFKLDHVKVLIQRHTMYSMLSAEGIRSIMARNIISGGIYSILYYQNFSILMKTGYVVSITGADFVSEFYNIMGLVYSIVTNVFMMNAVSVPALYQLNRFYSVEKEKKLYHFGALWLTFFVVDMIQQAFGALLFSILIYRFVELDLPFLTLFYPMMMLTALFASSVAMWCGLVNKNATSALALFIVIAVFNMNFAGYLVTENQMKDWLDWLLPLSFMRYAVGLLFNEIFSGVYVLGDVLIKLWGYDDMSLNKCVLISLGWFVGIQILILVAMFPWPSRLKKYTSKQQAAVRPVHSSTGGAALNPLCDDLVFGDSDVDERGDSIVQLSSLSLSQSSSPSGSVTQPSVGVESCSEPEGTGRGSIMGRISNVFDTDLDRGSVASYVENRESYFHSSAARSLPEDKKVTFSFQNMTYTIPVKGEVGDKNKHMAAAATERQLLCNVSGVVRPGEMMALMGPSGAGKTTLLNALAGRTNSGKLEGTMYINSTACESLRAASSSTETPFYCFVMQDDHHNPMLTVKETLTFAAMLRKRTSNKREVATYVENTIEILGLNNIADDFVNTPEKRTMSNGQLRRLTIGVEVVCAPALCFFDEPTSGLDSYLALSVVNSLKSLAKAGHTILCTIHQPSSVTFDKFDKLTLLCAGKMLYHGEISAGTTYFEKLGHVNNFVNSAEYFIDVCSSISSSSDNSELKIQMLFNIDHDIEMIVQAPRRPSAVRVAQAEETSFLTILLLNWHMISTLFQRDCLTNIRRADFWLVCMFKALAAGVLTGLVFFDVEDNTIIPRLAAGVVSFSYMTLFLNEYTPLCHDEKLIFYRENEVKVVSAFAQWLVVGFLFSILLAVSVLCYTLPLYYLMGLRPGWSHAVTCYGTMLLQLFSSIYTVQLVVYLTPNATVTATIFPGFILLLQGSMCGFSILISTMPDWVKWVKYPNALYWAMNAFFQNEFKDNPRTVGYEGLADAFEYDNTISRCFFIVAMISVGIRILTLVAMNYVTFSKS